jgi:uncharacterized protein YukE
MRYTAYDSSARPTAGTTDDGRTFTIEYGADGGSVVRYADGTIALYDAEGDPVRLQTPSATFTRFDDEGRPTGGVTSDGEPISIAYDGGGGSTVTVGDSVHTYGPTGDLVTLKTSSATFHRFDDQGRPTAGTSYDGTPITIAYGPDGSSTVTTGGTRMVYGPDGEPRQLVTGDATFTQFDADGRPVGGVTTGGERVTVSYGPDGSSTVAVGDVTSRYDADGDLVSIETPNARFTEFDDQGRPTGGRALGDDGQRITLTYHPDGSRVEKTGDSTMTYDVKGDPVRLETPGAIFTSFDDQGRPIRGESRGADGGQQIVITHRSDGSSVVVFGTSTTIHYDAKGVPTLMIDGSGIRYTQFDNQGRPTLGTLPGPEGGTISLTYFENGDIKHEYADESWIVYGPNGTPKLAGDGGTTVDFSVAIPELGGCADFTRQRRSVIAGHMTDLVAQVERAKTNWSGPAGDAYAEYSGEVRRSADQLLAALDEAIRRLDATYRNYVNTEQQNTQNLTTST